MVKSRKRRCESEDEEIRRKISELQERLNKTSKRRRILSSSDSETETAANIEVSPTPSRGHPRATTPQCNQEPVAGTSTMEDPALVPADPIVNMSDTEVELDAEVLELLGDAPKTNIVLGPSVHKDIATRWQDILNKGLTKEVRDKLMKEYIVPSNCDLLLAPELNPEAKAAIPEPSVKRDTSISAKQTQIGIALSALAITMDRVLHKDYKNVLKPLSDACRILCDSHFKETRTRRNFVLGAVNSMLKETLTKTQRDKYLFGENIAEKLKNAKIIQKSSDDLKIPAPKSQFNKNNFVKKNNLNYQHRKTQFRGETRGSRGGFTQSRPVTRSARQQQSREPPPPQRYTRSPPRPYRSPPPRGTASARR